MDGAGINDAERSLCHTQGARYFLTPETEREIAERYMRRTKRPSEYVYEFTRDPGLLHQYFILREQMFASVWDLPDFKGDKDEYDDRSHILVARKGNQVIAGARLTVSSPKQPQLLPMEGDDFRLKDAFPELNLEHRKYGSLSKMVVMPYNTSNDVTLECIRQLFRKSVALGLCYMFAVSPKIAARVYCQKCSKLGIPYALSSYAIPDREEYEGIKMQLQKYTILGEEAEGREALLMAKDNKLMHDA